MSEPITAAAIEAVLRERLAPPSWKSLTKARPMQAMQAPMAQDLAPTFVCALPAVHLLARAA